jgi:adenylosuccinate lyase
MIDRYTRPEMGSIWTDENKYSIWLEIEILACEGQAKLGLVPPEALAVIKSRAKFEIARILEIESEVKHDVIAFLTNVGEAIGSDSRFLHLGMTSSDVLDTALAVQSKQSADLLIKDLETLKSVLAKRAREFKHTVMIGRTHGVHAEPITFGLKLALWYAEIGRHIERLQSARERIAVGKISGAVGTFAHIDPSVETYVCEKLGLKPAPISTQVIQRDRHAEYLSVLALIGCTLEKIAVEIRHLQKTETLEAEESFSKGQKGSSAMPHKRNPIVCERIVGISRILRGNALAAMENVALWHERDISHSSVERVIFPDSNIALDFALADCARVIENLVVYPENMAKNLASTGGLIFSQDVLLALTEGGMKREDAYALVQHHAMNAWNTREKFFDLLRGDERVLSIISPKKLEELFDPERSLKHIDTLFGRVGLTP